MATPSPSSGAPISAAGLLQLLKHAQLTADAYKISAVMVTYDYSNVVIRAPSSFQSAEAIRAAIPTAGLLGMAFSGCGGAGHWDSIDIARASDLLNTRAYVQAESDKCGRCRALD